MSPGADVPTEIGGGSETQPSLPRAREGRAIGTDGAGGATAVVRSGRTLWLVLMVIAAAATAVALATVYWRAGGWVLPWQTTTKASMSAPPGADAGGSASLAAARKSAAADAGDPGASGAGTVGRVHDPGRARDAERGHGSATDSGTDGVQRAPRADGGPGADRGAPGKARPAWGGERAASPAVPASPRTARGRARSGKGDRRWLIQRGSRLLEAGHYARSRRYLNRALAIQEDHEVHWLIGRTYQRANKHRAAIRHVRRAIALGPTKRRGPRYFVLGYLYLETREKKAACAAFNKARKSAPKHRSYKKAYRRYCRR